MMAGSYIPVGTHTRVFTQSAALTCAQHTSAPFADAVDIKDKSSPVHDFVHFFTLSSRQIGVPR